jgi:hypothetical protein
MAAPHPGSELGSTRRRAAHPRTPHLLFTRRRATVHPDAPKLDLLATVVCVEARSVDDALELLDLLMG